MQPGQPLGFMARGSRRWGTPGHAPDRALQAAPGPVKPLGPLCRESSPFPRGHPAQSMDCVVFLPRPSCAGGAWVRGVPGGLGPHFCPSSYPPHVLQTSPTLQSGLSPLFSGGGEVPISGLYHLSESTDQKVPLDHAGGRQRLPSCPGAQWLADVQQGAVTPQDLAPGASGWSISRDMTA